MQKCFFFGNVAESCVVDKGTFFRLLFFSSHIKNLKCFFFVTFFLKFSQVQKLAWSMNTLSIHQRAILRQRIESWMSYRKKVLPYRRLTHKEHYDYAHLFYFIQLYGSVARSGEEGTERCIQTVKKQSKKARNTPNPKERLRNDLVNCAVATRPRARKAPTGKRKTI